MSMPENVKAQTKTVLPSILTSRVFHKPSDNLISIEQVDNTV